jgi:hypothetical protein
MTLISETNTHAYECGTCHSPAALQSDSSPFSLDSDQWYECINGHITKNTRGFRTSQSRR